MKTYLALLPLVLAGCSPLTSSPYDGKYQLELTLHELQTSLDDVRHDLNAYRTELQIVEERVKHQEEALAKNQDSSKSQSKIERLAAEIQSFEAKWTATEKVWLANASELRSLSSNAKETTLALTQFRQRIAELEAELISGQRRFEEIGKLKGNIDSLAKALRVNGCKIYKIRQGDSLDKIAKQNKTTVEKIKKLNEMDQDLIVVGQELKIPSE